MCQSELCSLPFYRNYLHQGHTNHQSNGHCTPDQISPDLPMELDSAHYSLHLETIFQPLLTLMRGCLSLLFITGFSDKNCINFIYFHCLPFCPSAVLVSRRANLWCRLFLRASVYIQNPTEHKKWKGLASQILYVYLTFPPIALITADSQSVHSIFSALKPLMPSQSLWLVYIFL